MVSCLGYLLQFLYLSASLSTTKIFSRQKETEGIIAKGVKLTRNLIYDKQKNGSPKKEEPLTNKRFKPESDRENSNLKCTI
jgi:hypothetical protein